METLLGAVVQKLFLGKTIPFEKISHDMHPCQIDDDISVDRRINGSELPYCLLPFTHCKS